MHLTCPIQVSHVYVSSVSTVNGQEETFPTRLSKLGRLELLDSGYALLTIY
jgi:hypothetical protein